MRAWCGLHRDRKWVRSLNKVTQRSEGTLTWGCPADLRLSLLLWLKFPLLQSRR